MRSYLVIPAILGLLWMSGATAAQAATINLSSGTATYQIGSDTNAGEATSGTATIVSMLASWVANPISDGIGDSGVWISPATNGDQSNADRSTSVEQGDTTYDLFFSLAGLNPNTAVLTMALAADDYVSVTLNTNPIFTPSASQVSNGMWSSVTAPFSVNDSTGFFVPGLNELVFTVPNDPSDGAGSCCGPTGLDVAASVTASAVPEPSTALPLGLALLACGFIVRKRVRSAA